MKPLIVLLSVFVISLLIVRFTKKKFDWAISARIAMSAMLLFTTMGHFMFPDGMAMMIPDIISLPSRKALVYLTAVIEVAAAIGLHVPEVRRLTGLLLIVFFVFTLSANINAALNNLDYQTGTFDGPGPDYLWFRVPLQLFFIIWVYCCAVRNPFIRLQPVK